MRYSNPERRTLLKTMTSLAAASSMAKLAIEELQCNGVDSLHGIAKALTDLGLPTPRGADTWRRVQVGRILRLASI